MQSTCMHTAHNIDSCVLVVLTRIAILPGLTQHLFDGDVQPYKVILLGG